MTCYHPMPGWQAREGAQVRLSPPRRYTHKFLELPCGKCLGCRQDRATQWALRCEHEAKRYRYNTFLTLTYDDEHLPPDGTLRPRDYQLFIKRLRRSLGEAHPIKYFACGEYGHQEGRPHYHALVFNWQPDDMKYVGKDLYSSGSAAALWTHGDVKAGDAEGGAAGYIAKYALKGTSGIYCNTHGVELRKPFLRMSQGIGKHWITKYATDVQHGYLIQAARKRSIPRYYKDRIKKTDSDLYAALQTRTQELIATRTTEYNERNKRLQDAEKIHAQRKQVRQ